jgi:hypothetical protein
VRGSKPIDGSIDYNEIKSALYLVRLPVDHKPGAHLSRQVFV